MFDSGPPTETKTSTVNDPVLARLSFYRQNAKRVDKVQHADIKGSSSGDDQMMFDIIARWRGDVGELRDAIEMASDWGPYELVEMIPAYYGDDEARRILCRFLYHGDAAARSQFEHCLRATLLNITEWENAPQRPHPDPAT
ncbi:MAG: hypothetical protein DHS20C05_08550 [Hyphococcus sp.]|nr:MAG: hypothetical protein DHS20C05_08550 [Marinicaulis sp.]